MKFIKPAIILVRPQLPENIGMVARVMQNFNLNELILVSPRDKWPNKKSLNASKQAHSIIKKSKVHKSIPLAIAKFNFVIATTNRRRFLNKNTTNSFNTLRDLIINKGKTAIIFGPENSGLSNEDLRLADCLFTIDTSYNNNSLNLSHAVSIISYKIYELFSNKINNESKNKEKKMILSNKNELNRFISFMILELEKKNFFNPISKKQSMIDNIYAIFLKSSLSKKEVNTLWGILKKLIK